MMGLWIADMVIVKREIKLSSSRTIWPLLALVIVAFISFIAGQFPWFTFANNAPLDAQAGGFAIFVLSVGAYLLAAHLVRDVRWLEIMVWLFLAVGTLFLAGRAAAFIRPLTTAIIQPQAIGGVFYAWFPALALGQALFNRDLRPVWRAALIGATALCLYVGLAIFFNWKSGWLPPVAAVVVIIFLRARRLSIAAALLAIVPVLLFIPDFLASDSYSVSTRLDAWIIMGEIVKVNPILGLGFANYYWYTPLFRIRGWTVTFNSHNNYVDIVAQTGISGLLFFLWFFVEIGRLAWRLKDSVPEGFAKGYVYSCLGGIVATLVAAMLGDWVLPFVYNIGLSGFRTGVLAWLFLGGLVAIENIYTNGKTLPVPAAITPSAKQIG
jgi:O-antigen ligase